MRVSFFRPRWLRAYNRELSSVVKFYLAKRIANSGRPTFALYYSPRHRGNEGFPVPFTELLDMPISVIREFLEDAVVGKKILERANEWTWGYVDEVERAAEIGRKIRESQGALFVVNSRE